MTERAPTCFLSGETVDLHAIDDADVPQWASWFNNPKITRYLPQGVFPNSLEDQHRFIKEAGEARRFLALVKSKGGNLLGVVSLSDIDHRKRACQIALVVPEKDPTTRFPALEAMCMLVQHAFESMDLDRVWGGQFFPGLVRWSQSMELIGFVTEGIHRATTRTSRASSDTMTVAITFSDFSQISERRNGRLWPGEASMAAMVAALQGREPYARRLSNFVDEAQQEQGAWLAELDVACQREPDAPANAT